MAKKVWPDFWQNGDHRKREKIEDKGTREKEKQKNKKKAMQTSKADPFNKKRQSILQRGLGAGERMLQKAITIQVQIDRKLFPLSFKSTNCIKTTNKAGNRST